MGRVAAASAELGWRSVHEVCWQEAIRAAASLWEARCEEKSQPAGNAGVLARLPRSAKVCRGVVIVNGEKTSSVALRLLGEGLDTAAHAQLAAQQHARILIKMAAASQRKPALVRSSCVERHTLASLAPTCDSGSQAHVVGLALSRQVSTWLRAAAPTTCCTQSMGSRRQVQLSEQGKCPHPRAVVCRRLPHRDFRHPEHPHGQGTPQPAHLTARDCAVPRAAQRASP